MSESNQNSPFSVIDIRSGYHQIPITDSQYSRVFQMHLPDIKLGKCEECERLKNELAIVEKRLEESEKGRAEAEQRRAIAEAELTSLKEMRARGV